MSQSNRSSNRNSYLASQVRAFYKHFKSRSRWWPHKILAMVICPLLFISANFLTQLMMTMMTSGKLMISRWRMKGQRWMAALIVPWTSKVRKRLRLLRRPRSKKSNWKHRNSIHLLIVTCSSSSSYLKLHNSLKCQQMWVPSTLIR